VAAQLYEAYNSSTNIYSFAFYNDTLTIPINPLTSDLPFDYVPLKAGTGEVLNGNMLILGDVTEGYTRPTTAVTLNMGSYDPGIGVTNPSGTPITVAAKSESNHPGYPTFNQKKDINVLYSGTVKTGDKFTIQLRDVRNYTNVLPYPYTVPAGQDGDSPAAINSFMNSIPNTYHDAGNPYNIHILTPDFFVLDYARVDLADAGAGISKSVSSLKTNSFYQWALSYRDKYGRVFPLRTDDRFVTKTQSYAQNPATNVSSGLTYGLPPVLNWTIDDVAAPAGAVDYQWLRTDNLTHQTFLDMVGCIIAYKGTWNANTNTPTLAVNVGAVGDTYQITTPSIPTDYRNLGGGAQAFNTGDYVSYNGQSWDIIPKAFANLTDVTNYLFIKINPLALFNQQYDTSVLNYDYTIGDRLTLYNRNSSGTYTWYNNPAVEVELLGYDPTTYILKAAKSSSITISDLTGKDLQLEIYTPKLKVSAKLDATVFWEAGIRYPITSGLHTVLSGSITDGDIYFKTRELRSAINPNNLLELQVEDPNFSDFYISNFNSDGRPRTYFDVQETIERKASMRYSDVFILGSKVNGLTRFFPERIYGDGAGQCSSNYGAINKLIQRNNVLVIIQELKEGYAPVYAQILEDNAEQQTVAISDKILGNIRYNGSGNIGMGGAKESCSFYGNNIWYVDINRSEPIRSGLDGVKVITSKLSKFFKNTLQVAYALGNKIVSFYDVYNEEWVMSVQVQGSRITAFSFTSGHWQVLSDDIVAPADITPGAASHGSISYNSGTGRATYTPTTSYFGADSFPFTFGTTTKNECGTVTEGDITPFDFTFAAQYNVPLSIYINSNIVSIGGINIVVAISVTGGDYSINGAAFTSAAGTISNGDSLQLRVMSSASDNTMVTASVTVGTLTRSFEATTLVSSSPLLYAGNNLDLCYFNVSIDDGAGHVYPLGPMGQQQVLSTPIVAGTYEVTARYISPTGLPEASVLTIGSTEMPILNSFFAEHPVIIPGIVIPGAPYGDVLLVVLNYNP